MAHESRAGAARHWKEFSEDPEWRKLAEASVAGGKIIESVESTYMTPADFSPLK